MQLNHPNRAIAKAQNETQYFTNIPCRNNHLSNRWVVNGACVECSNNIRTRHRLTDKFKETTKAYTKSYKPKLIFKIYGMTEEQHKQMLMDQNFKCKICDNKLEEFRKTHIDHCHNSNKVRGVLCWTCNVGLGHLKHNPELLRKAALYCEQS